VDRRQHRATGWLLQQMFSDHLARQFDHELNIHLNQLAASIEFDVAGNLSVQPLSDPRLQQPYSGLYWQIDALPGPGTRAQNALRRSRSLWDSRLQVQADQLGDGELHTHQITGPNGETLRLNERIFRLEEPRNNRCDCSSPPTNSGCSNRCKRCARRCSAAWPCSPAVCCWPHFFRSGPVCGRYRACAAN